MRFVNKRFDFEITAYYRKFIINLFKRMVNREIKGFNNVLNSFKILEIESEVLVVWHLLCWRMIYLFIYLLFIIQD
jgi:hypothetical protein